jgi:membrane protease YdiL (CAAX protease family)
MGAAYALEWNRHAAWLLGGGFILALLAKLGALLVGTQLGLYYSAPGGVPLEDFLQALAWTTVFTFVPSIAEDILTRGFWARVPAWRWSAWRFVLFSSSVYVLNHVYRLGNGPTEWLMLFCFGLAYATALWRTGSLWAAVGLHWGWNFAGAMLGAWWDDARPGGGWWLSAITHLLLTAICLLFVNAAAAAVPRESSSAPADGT